MHSFVRAAVVSALVLFGSHGLVASETVCPAAPAFVSAGPAVEFPFLIGQTTSNSTSSGGSYRVPRGLVKLVIFGGIALVGAAGWVIKKLTAA